MRNLPLILAGSIAARLRRTRLSSRSALGANLLALTLLPIPLATAGNTWTGGGASTNWSDSNNWGGAQPTYGTLTFTTGGAQGLTSIVDQAYSMNQLLWTGASAWTLNNSGGFGISLFDNGGTQAKIENQSTGLVTINAPITFAATAGAAWGEINAVNGNLTFAAGGTINVTGSAVNELRFFGTGRTVTINSVLTAGARKLVIGPGVTDNNTVILNAANSYSGNTEVNVGTVQVGNNTGLGTSAVFLGNGGTTFANLSGSLLLNAAGLTVSNAITTNKADTGAGLGTGTRTIGGNFTTGTSTFSGGITLNGGAVLTAGSGGTVAFSGIIQNGVDTGNISRNLTVSGAGGTVVLSGVNTYTGTTTVSTGVLNIQNASALGTVAAGTTVASGAALQIQGGITTLAEALTLSGTGIATDGALRNISGANNFAGLITLGAATRINSDAGTLTISNAGTITGATFGLTLGGAGATVVNSIIGTTTGTLTKDGAGTATLTGANTYTGLTTVSAGVLRITNNTSLGTVAGGVTQSGTSELDIDGTGGAVIVGAEALSINGGGITNLGALRNIAGNNTYGGTVTMAAQSRINSDAGTLTLNNATAAVTGAFTLVVGGAGNVTISTPITTGAGGVSKDGAGTLTLSGANTYTGAVTVSVGTVQLGNILGLGTVAGGVTVSATGAVLDLNGIAVGAEALALNGTGISSGGALINSSATAASLSGTINLASNSSLGGNGAGLMTLSGVISGTGTLTKVGTGTTLLSGVNTYATATTISAGTLQLGNVAGLGTTAAGTTVSATGAALDLNGIVVGAEPLTLNGTGISSGGALINSSATAASLSGTINLATDSSIGGNGAGLMTLSGIVSGTGTLTKVGTGTVLLSAANTYATATIVNAGTLRVGNITALGTTAAGTTVSATGAVLDLNGIAVGAEALTLNGTGISSGGALINSSATAASLSGTINLATNASVGGAGAGAMTLSGIISGGSVLTKVGSGTTILSAANTYSGGTTVTAGILQLNAAAGAGTGTITQAASSTGRILVNAGVTITNPVVITAGVTGTASTGLIQQNGTGLSTVNGSITLNGVPTAGGTFLASNTVGNELVLGGAISGSVGASQRDGRVIYKNATSTATGNFLVTGTALVGVNNGIPVGWNVQLGGSAAGTLDLNGFDQSLPSLQMGSGAFNATAALGTRTLTLTGNLTSLSTGVHTFTGTGTLALGANAAVFTVGDNAAESDLSIAPGISGTAGFSKAGAGTLLLTGNVTNTGTLAVTAGTLAGGTTISGPLSIGTGTTLQTGTSITVGTITAPSLALGSGSTTIRTKIGTGSGVINGGTVTNAGTATFNITQFGGLLVTGNTYPLINYTGTSPGLGGFALGTLPGHVLGTLVEAGSAIAFNVTGNDKVVWDATIDGNWNINTTANWKTQLGNAAANYLEGDAVVFQDAPTGVTAGNVTLLSNVLPTSVEFTNTVATPYTISAASALGIGGTAFVTKTGNGLATLRTANSYTGATTISAGTLELDHDATGGVVLSATSGVSVSPGATLLLTRDGTATVATTTFTRAITGGGNLDINIRNGVVGTVADTIVLSANNSGFTGPARLLTPTSGSYRLSLTAPSQIGTGGIEVQNGTQIFVSGTAATYTNNITITGTGFVDSAGNIGALRLDGSTWAGNISVNGSARIGSHNSTGTISGIVSGGNLEFGATNFNNNYTTILTATNIYGTTTIGGQNIQVAAVPLMRLNIGSGGTTGTLGAGNVIINGDGASGILGFDRSDLYTLLPGQTITASNGTGTIANSIARTFIDFDVLGTGFSDNGNAITLGAATATTGGQFRIGQSRAGAIASFSGTLTGGQFRVGSGQGSATANLNSATGNFGNVHVGVAGTNLTSTLNINGTTSLTAAYFTAGEAANSSGIINQAAGTSVSIGTHARIGHFSTETSTYNLNGGSLTITAASPATTPSALTELDGGIYLGIDGTGILNHNGGTVTTNWIVLDNRGDTLAGANMPDGIDRYNLSGAASVLNLRSTWGLIQRNSSSAVSFGGGTVRVDNTGTGTGTGANITIPLDATIDTVAASTTNLDTNGAGNGFTLTKDVRGTGTLNLTGGGTINFTTTGFQNIAASLSSSGTGANIVKLGAGATTLAGSASGFMGNVTVSAGRLNVPNNLGVGAITVADAAILSGEPVLVTTLTLGATTGSTLFFDPNTAGAITAGTLTVNGANTLDFTALPTGLGPYTAINYTTRTGAGTFAVANPANFRTAPVVNDTGSSITVDITGTKVLTWVSGGTPNNAWNINSAINWVDAGLLPEKFYTADTVIFPEGGANPSIALTGVLVPNGVIVNASTTAYTFTSTAGNQISGGTGITKTNGGTLTFAGPNVYTGQTSIGGGTVIISTPTSLGDGSATNNIAISGGGRLSDIGAVAFDLGSNRSIAVGAGGGSFSHNNATAAAITISGNLTGSGANTLSFHSAAAGAGTFILTGNNSGYTGNLSVDAVGTGLTVLQIASQNAASAGGSITLNYPAAGATGNATTLNLPGVSLPAAVTLNLTSLNSGANSLRSQVTSSGASAINGPVILSGDAVVQILPAANSTLTLGGPISGSLTGTFFLRSTGTSILNGTINLPTGTLGVTDGALGIVNSTGNTLFTAQPASGTLRLGNNDALGTTANLIIGQSGAAAATLDLNGFNQTVATLTYLATTNNLLTIGVSNSHATATSTLTVNQAADATFNGTFSGRINLVKGGANSLTLPSAASTFSGNVTVNNGTFVASAGGTANGSAGTLGAANVAGRTVTVNSPGILSFTSNNIFGNGQSNANLPAVVINSGAMLISTRYNVLGNVALNGGTLTQASTDTGIYQGFQLLGSVTVGGSAPSFISTTNGKGTHLAANSAFVVADATVSAAVDLTVNTPLINQSGDFASAAGGFTKSGLGTMALTATSAYTGATAVTAGTLQIGDGATAVGQLGATTVTVSTGATFAYNRTGSVGQSGALNSATVGAGTFNVSGDGTTAVSLDAGGTFSGAINVNNGTLIAGATNPWSSHLTSPTFTLAAGTTLTNGASNHAHIGSITMNGAMWTTSALTGSYDSENYQLNGDVTIAGTAASTITRDGSRTDANSGISLRGTRIFNVGDVTGDAAVDLTVSTELENTDAATVILAGAGALAKTGAGTMLITTPASYTGATTVNNGILRISGGNDRLPTGTNLAVNGGATFGGTFDLNGQNQTVGGLSGASGAVSGVITSANGPATLTANIAGAGSFTTAANINDTGANVVTFTKLGTGTQELTGSSSYTGTTTVSAGTLQLNRLAGDNTTISTDGNTATTSDIVINGGTLVLAASEQIGDTGSISLSSGSLGFNGTGLIEKIDKLTVSGGTFSTGANQLIVGGATVTWSGGTNTINTGGLVSDKHWVITGGTNTVQQTGLLRVQSGTGTTGLHFGGTGSPTITVDMDASNPGVILLKQDVFVDASLTSGTAQILNGAGTGLSGQIDMNGGTRTFDISNGSASSDLLISAEIANGSLIKTSAGTLTLTGNNTFTGTTTINAGTLEAGAAGALGATTGIIVNTGGTLLLSGSGDRINNSATLTLAGGTFDAAGLSETLGTLTLTDDSIIDFGGGASTLSFADSTGLWTTGKTLSIWNWSGNPVSGGGTDQLRFASNGLDINQLGQINFYSGPGTGQLSITPAFPANGFVSFGEVVPVPEPSSIATVMGLLGLVGWRERRKARSARAAERRIIG